MRDLEDDELDEESGAPIDPFEVGRFVFSSAKRHWKLGAGVAVTIAALGITVGAFLPKTYETRTRILVGQEGIMSQVNPDRVAPKVDEFRGLNDRIFSQESLRGIVVDADLATLWTKHRPPFFRFKDSLLGNGLETYSPEDRTRALMGTLETKLFVETDNSTSITFGARWGDPETVTRIVETTKKRFLEGRLRQEIEMFTQVITILEGEAKAAARDVERDLKNVEKASWYTPPATPGAKSSPTVVEVSAGAPKKAEPDPLVVVKLEKVRQQIREVQEPWQRRITELKLRLTDLRASYGPKHPLVVHQETRISDASQPPPELESLQGEEARLLQQIESFSVPDDGKSPRRTRVIQAGGAPSAPTGPVRINESASLSAEQSRLILAINKYNDLSVRISSTRLEIATAETVFKYRYVVAAEPEMPKAPLKPKLPLLIALGSIVFGALVGLLIGPARELLKGKLLATFQVRQLGLPVIAEVDLTGADVRKS